MKKGRAGKKKRAAGSARSAGRIDDPVETGRQSLQPIKLSDNQAQMSADEAKLWAQVTESLSPLSGKAMQRVAVFIDDSQAQDIQATRRITANINGDGTLCLDDYMAGRGPSVAGNSGALKSPGSGRDPVPSASSFDKRKLRKVGKGRISIDARIDLHGMRQREAYSLLRSFLFDSQRQGRRLVLVITGKGTSERRRDDDDYGWGGYADEPGVLRRNAPLWMAEPDLAAIIVSYTAAHQRHGGDGAFYVHLRKA